MWNEEKQQALLKAQELVQQLEREKEEYENSCVIKLAGALDDLDTDCVFLFSGWETVAQFLLDNRDAIIKLLEDIK